MKTNPKKFQFMVLSKTRRLEYNLLIRLNVIKHIIIKIKYLFNVGYIITHTEKFTLIAEANKNQP